MRKLFLLIFIFSILTSNPAHGNNSIVIDFRGEKSVFAGESIHLIDLFQRRASGYTREQISDVIVYASSRNRHYGGYVQLLDENRMLISQDSLSNGYASLPIYEKYQKPAFLYFENDTYVNRVELITDGYQRGLEQRKGKRFHKQKRPPELKRTLEIGNFVKKNYQSEIKKFSFPSGGVLKNQL